MIRHPNIGMNFPARSLHRLLQARQHPLVIIVAMKQSLPRVAASHHMVNRAWKLNAEGACHPGILATTRKTVNRV